MIPSLEGYPIEMLAEETATKNKIGTEKNDNGILLLIAKDDRELRIEVGYGLEGAVPDAIASSIIRNVIRPRFRDDEYYQGISEGVNAIISAIGGEYKAEDADKDDGFPISMIVIIIILIWCCKQGRSICSRRYLQNWYSFRWMDEWQQQLGRKFWLERWRWWI